MIKINNAHFCCSNSININIIITIEENFKELKKRLLNSLLRSESQRPLNWMALAYRVRQ